MGSTQIAVIGSGAWGTALAAYLGHRDHEVRQWVREPELVTSIGERRENDLFLPGVEIPATVRPTTEIEHAASGVKLVVAAVPSPFARSVYRRIAPHLEPDVPVLVLTKGIEEETLALPLAVAAEELGADRPLAVLSGPSFAPEFAAGGPTAVVVAAAVPELSARLQQMLSSRDLRLYTNRDPVGVQLAGALKNVVAISAGMADGLGMGLNARAALITRGLAEMRRLGCRLGGEAATFAGLAGLGDLVLTCTGDLSRNRRVGRALARGETLQQIVERTRSVAEGVRTSRSARNLARRAGVEMPIVEEVHRILYEGSSMQESLERLLRRPLTAEDDERVAEPT